MHIRGEWFDKFMDEWHEHVSFTDAPADIAWVDLETTGLEADKDVTLEMGIVLTDSVGRICRDGVASWLVWGSDPGVKYQKNWSRSVLDLNDIVFNMHTKSGLLDDLSVFMKMGESFRAAEPSVVAEDARLWLTERVPHMAAGEMPMSGSSAHFDRGFIRADMSHLDTWFHYRCGVDVSSIRETMRLHRPDLIACQPLPTKGHRPIPDLIDSIRLYRHMLKHFLNTGKDVT